MRLFLSLFLLVSLFACSKSNSQLPNNTKEGIVAIKIDTEDRYNLVYADMLEGQKTVKAEADGTANIEVKGNTEIGFFLQSGAVSFFAQPGDQIEISTNEGQPVVKTGSAAYDEYLSVKTGLLAESLGTLQERMRLDSDAYLERENYFQDVLDANLEDFSDQLPADLVKSEQSAIRMQKATSLIQYPNYYAYLNQGQRPENSHRATLDKVLASKEAYDLTNPTFIDLHMEIAMGKEAATLMQKGESVTSENYVEFQINAVKKHISDEAIRKVALPKTLASVIEFDMNRALEEFEGNESAIAAEYQDDMKELFASWSKLLPGKMAPDFDTVDMEGNSFKLSDLRGKYVYINVWATWCEPCKEEIPYLTEMNSKYSEEDVVILSVSIDDEQQTWKKMVKDRNLQGKHIYTEGAFASSVAQKYKISGIPRFMLVDPEGKIVSVQAQRPSGKITETIDALLAS
jgi:thiol-disulfide isomerase/thioredoxin